MLEIANFYLVQQVILHNEIGNVVTIGKGQWWHYLGCIGNAWS